jgi:CBS domain-containing protein
VSQLLTNKEPLVTISPSATVHDALTLMTKSDYSQLPVVDEGGDLLGIISEHNVLTTYFFTSDQVSILDQRVDNCQGPAKTVSSGSDLFEVLDFLESEYAVVVMDGRKPAGILTAYDATHFLRELSEDLILVEDIEITLRQYAESLLPEGNVRDAALLRAFGADKQEPTRPAKEHDELSFSDQLQLLANHENWQKFAAYLEPRELFLALMEQVGPIRNQLAHFRGSTDPMQHEALLKARDWLATRARPPGREVKHVTAREIPSAEDSAGTGKYERLLSWLKKRREAGDTSLSIALSEVEDILVEPLPPSARQHRSWWANDYSTHVQARAWLDSGWLVDDVNFERGEVVFRQSNSALYPGFWTTMLELLKEKRPGITQTSRVFVQNWISFSAGRTGLFYVWSLPKEGGPGGSLRVEFDINTGDKDRNKLMFDALSKQQGPIEAQAGVSLRWERLDGNKMSRITTSRPFKLATAAPDEIGEVQSWGVSVMLQYIDAFGPHVRKI